MIEKECETHLEGSYNKDAGHTSSTRLLGTTEGRYQSRSQHYQAELKQEIGRSVGRSVCHSSIYCALSFNGCLEIYYFRLF